MAIQYFVRFDEKVYALSSATVETIDQLFTAVEVLVEWSKFCWQSRKVMSCAKSDELRAGINGTAC